MLSSHTFSWSSLRQSLIISGDTSVLPANPIAVPSWLMISVSSLVQCVSLGLSPDRQACQWHRTPGIDLHETHFHLGHNFLSHYMLFNSVYGKCPAERFSNNASNTVNYYKFAWVWQHPIIKASIATFFKQTKTVQSNGYNYVMHGVDKELGRIMSNLFIGAVRIRN